MKRLRHALVAGALIVPIVSVAPAQATAPSAGRLAITDVGTGQIYTVDASGAGLTQLTHLRPQQVAFDANWSPDGTRLVYNVVLSDGRERLYTSAPDGSDVQPVLHERGRWGDDAADYFPDGTHLAFARCLRLDPGYCAIYRVGTDGSGLTPLTSPGLDTFDFNPDVSPDGTQITFVRFNSRGVQAQVWVMDADGSNAHPVTRPGLQANFPSWSADGQSITVSSNCCRLAGDIYRVAATGGTPMRLTSTKYPNYSGFTAASPDGQQLAFVSDRHHPDKCCVDLYVMDADGSNQRMVETGLTAVVAVAWDPSG